MTLRRSRRGPTEDTQRLNTLRVGRVAAWALANLDTPTTLDDLATRACLSRFHFARIFKELTGETPLAFFRRLRLERAAWALRTPGTRVIDVALSAGFDTPEGFTRAFRAGFGQTPDQFRRAPPPLAASANRPTGFFRLPNPPLDPRNHVMMLDLRPMPEIRYLAARSVGPYTSVGPAFRRVVGWCIQNALMTPTSQIIGLSYDNPNRVPADLLRYDAGVTLERVPVGLPPDLAMGALPACTWAMTQHRGSYATMPATFKALWDALAARPELIVVPLPPIEIYLNDPGEVAAEDLLTDLGVAVAVQT